MKLIEIIMLLLTAGYSVYAMISDLRCGRISNVSVIITTAIAVVLDIAYYGFFRPDILMDFGITAGVMTAIAAGMYLLHIWAAGDCKLLFVLAISYPAGLYFNVNGYNVTLWLSVVLAFVVGFLYIAAESVAAGIREKHVISRKVLFSKLKQFLVSYAVIIIYVAFVNIIMAMLFTSDISLLLMPVIMLAAAVCAAKFIVFRNKAAIIIVLAADIALSIYFTYIPLSGNWTSYVVVIAVAFAREFMGEYNYRTIPAESVEKGMVLSCSSSALMQSSSIKGLPPVSTEDLRSRLTQKQVDSIKRWSKTSPMYENISIVKKIPFAGFIAVGMIVYILLGVFVRAYLFQ